MAFDIEQFDGNYLELTPRKTVLVGQFNLSAAKVPYFQASMPLRQVCEELQLVESLRADFKEHWRIEELFQRDIDWTRVEQDIVNGYLERPEKRTFFNSLTVALLPLAADGVLVDDYGIPDVDPPLEGPFGHEHYTTKNIGGIQLALPRRDDSVVGYLRWDRKRVFAAAIDGQHRLAALRKYVHDNEVTLTAKQLDTSVPIIFLIMDERAGFRVEEGEESGGNRLLPLVREIFIDLNKHARTVSETRQVLLNDLEIESVCTRSLIASQVGVSTRDELPLGLVNWKTDKIKFDTGPYFTAVYALYIVVRDVLALKHPKDPTDGDQMLLFANSIEQRLNVADTISAGTGPYAKHYKHLGSLVAYVQKAHVEKDVPFKAPPKGYVLAARDAFARIYKPLFMGVFLNLKEYSDFWELSLALGGVDGDLAFFNGESEKVQRRLEHETWGAAKYNKSVSGPIEALTAYKQGKWPFYVVFQKALLRSTIGAFFASPAVLQAQASVEVFQANWHAYLNELSERGIFLLNCPVGEDSKSGLLWEGICLNPVSGSIRWSDAASRRIEDLLILGWYLRESKSDTPEAFVERLMEAESKVRFPDAAKMIKRLDSSLRSVGRQRGQLEDDEDIAEYAALRLMAVLKAMFRCSEK